MSGYTDQVTRELLALTEPGPTMIRARVREMLAEAWAVGYLAGRDDEAVAKDWSDDLPNPFASRG